MKNKLYHLRNEYKKQTLSIEKLDRQPLAQLKKWLDEAVNAQQADPTAMSLATVDSTGQPSQRIVLLKDISEKGLHFFTNYLSQKGKHLQYNPKASVNFFWHVLERQVRLEGRIKKLAPHESDLYFSTRPRESQIGAWASPQSEIVLDREFLNRRYHELVSKYKGSEIPRPPHWGGYEIIVHKVEFWQGRPGRMHDRFVYDLTTDGDWEINQLAP